MIKQFLAVALVSTFVTTTASAQSIPSELDLTPQEQAELDAQKDWLENSEEYRALLIECNANNQRVNVETMVCEDRPEGTAEERMAYAKRLQALAAECRANGQRLSRDTLTCI